MQSSANFVEDLNEHLKDAKADTQAPVQPPQTQLPPPQLTPQPHLAPPIHPAAQLAPAIVRGIDRPPVPPLIDVFGDPYAFQKLVYLHESLARLHQSNPDLFFSLYESRRLIASGNLAAALDILQAILHMGFLPPEIVVHHQNIETYLRTPVAIPNHW